MNRTARRRLKAPQRKDTTPPTPHPLTPGPPQSHSCPGVSTNSEVCHWIKKAAAWFFGTFLALLLAVVSFSFEFSPKIAISPYQPLELSDAFSSPFIVTNDGYLPFTDVSADCILNKAEFTKSAFKNRVKIGSGLDKASEMLPGEKLTVLCRFRENIGIANSDTLKLADISVVITYQYWLWPPPRQREFRFISAHASDGSWHWLPQPVSK